MAWVLLLIAGLLEVAWALGLRSTEGFTRLWPSLWVGGAMALSMLLLARAAREIPTPVAYAVWVGVGVVGAWAIGAAWLGQRATPVQWLCVAAVVAGVVGLKLTSTRAAEPGDGGAAGPSRGTISSPQ